MRINKIRTWFKKAIRKKRNIILLSVLGALLIFRLFLPQIILSQSNKALASMEGYKGKIEDIDVALFRGAFVINKLTITKDSSNIPIPFLTIEKADISIDWGALFHGRLVGEIILTKPQLNFAIDSTGTESQTGLENNWVSTLKQITPVDVSLNLLQVDDGKIYFKDYSQVPIVDVSVTGVKIKATNLSNVINISEKYPSNISLTGISQGGGDLKITAKTNILKKIPDFNLDFKLENMHLQALNSFTEGYANFDFESGTFSFFSELVMNNGSYDGYMKPMFENIDIINKGSDRNKSFLNKSWQVFLEGANSVLKNHKKDLLATKIPISGNINQTRINRWAMIGGILKNAYIVALPKKLEKLF